MHLRSWNVERKKVLFSHPRVVLTEEIVRLPGGQIIDDYLQIEVAEHVVIIVQSNDQKFLLQRQYKHGLRAVSLTFPAGVIKPGEEPTDAARRELQEETALAATEWHHFGRFVLNGNQGAGAAHLFLARGLAKTNQASSVHDVDLEEQEILWLSECELVERARRCEIQIASHALALGFALNPKLWPTNWKVAQS